MATRSHSVNFKLGVTGTTEVISNLKKVANQAKTLAFSVSGAFATIGGAGGFMGIKNIADLGGQLSDIAARTDLTAGEVLVLQQAFKDSGVEASQMQTAMAYLNKAIAGAKDGGQEYAEAFSRIGLSWEKLYSMRPAERFKTVSTAIASLGNSVDRTDVAMKLFSRSGQQLLTLFRDKTIFEKSERVLGGLPKMMENANVFDKISDSLGHTGIKSQQFFAGLLNQVDDSIYTILDKISGMDLTGVGTKVGLKFKESLEQVAAGDFWGGFTSGMGVIWAEFKKGFEWVTELANAAIKDFNIYPFIDSLKGALADIFLEFPKMFWDSFFSIGENIGERYETYRQTLNAQETVRVAQEELERQRDLYRMNEEYVSRQANPNSKVNVNRLAESAKALAKAQKAVDDASFFLQQHYTADDDFEKNQKNKFLAGLENSTFVGGNLQAAWDKLGLKYTPPVDSGKPSDEFGPLIQFPSLSGGLMSLRQKAQALAANVAARREIKNEQDLNALKNKGITLEENYATAANRVALIERDSLLSNAQKYSEKITLLNKEKGIIDDQIKNLERQNKVLESQIQLKSISLKTSDAETKKKLETEIRSYEKQLSLNSKKIGGLSDKGASVDSERSEIQSLYSFRDQIKQATNGIYNSFGTLQQQVGGLVETMADSLSTNLGGALTGIVLQTKSVAEAFAEMGTSLLNSIVSAIMGIVAKIIVAAAIIAPLNWMTGGFFTSLFGMFKISPFASGGLIPGGEKVVRVNELGQEYIVNAAGTSKNKHWLELANRGVNLGDVFGDSRRPSQIAGSSALRAREDSGGSIRRREKAQTNVTVQTHADLWSVLKGAGIVTRITREQQRRGAFA